MKCIFHIKSYRFSTMLLIHLYEHLAQTVQKREFAHTTPCKIEFTYASHCVSKNVTPRRMLKICFQIAKMNQPSDKASNFLIIAMVILVAMVITDAMVMHAGNGGQRGQDRQDRHLNFTFEVTCDWQHPQFLRCFIQFFSNLAI